MPKLLEAEPLIPVVDQTARTHVVGRQRGWALAAKELERAFRADAPRIPEGGKRYVTADEACADLGLDPETRAVAVRGLRNLVSEQATGFEVSKTLRSTGMKHPVIRELLTRGMRMLATSRADRAASEFVVRKAGPPPGAGWTPIPRGKRGGYRRPKSGGGFEYAYPDKDGAYTSHDTPAADEHSAVHEEHENGTPDPKVRARMEALEKKAKDAGLSFTGTATARTTMKHLNELERQLDRAIKQKAKRPPKERAEKESEPKKEEPEEKGPAEKPTEDEGDDTKPEPEPSQKQQRVRHIHALADQKALPEATLDKLLMDPDFQTEDGHHALIKYLEEMPDVPAGAQPKQPLDGLDDAGDFNPEVARQRREAELRARWDQVPEDKEAKKKLEEHASRLDDTVTKMERALTIEREAHAKEIAALRAEIRKLSQRPTPREAVNATHKVAGFALITFGFVAGFMFAGPMGALLLSSMANNLVKTGVAKSLPYEPPALSPGLWVVDGALLLVKATRHPEGSGWMSIPGGKKGGYRRPKAGGGFEYWYADAAGALEHHEGKAEEHRGHAARTREMAERPGVRRENLLQGAEVQDRKASGHDEAAQAAREAPLRPVAHQDGDNPHKGQKTLGPDEGKVWSTIADLFNGVEADGEGKVYLHYGMQFEPEYVQVKAVDGRMHNIKVEVRVGDGHGGHLSSKDWPSIGEDGRLDHSKMTRKPTNIVIDVPAGQLNRNGLVEQARRTLAHELAHAMDNLTSPHGRRDFAKYKEHGDAYYNDPAEIVAYRHNIFRELNTPEVAADVATDKNLGTVSPEEAKDIRQFFKDEGDDVGVLGRGGPAALHAATVLSALERHSDTWKQVSPFLTPANRRKMLTMAVAVLGQHHDEKSKPVAKALPPPPPLPGDAPPPRIRARHDANVYGHTDGLLPGQKLAVRKGAGGPEYVTVLPEGAFQWGDNRYPNGHQLLKALTGRENHRLTIRRYFGLGADLHFSKAMADALRAKYPDLLVSPFQGRVRVEGALAKAGIPSDNPRDTVALLDILTVQSILAKEPA